MAADAARAVCGNRTVRDGGDTMSVYNYDSRRAKEARFGKMFDSKPLRILLWIILAVSFGLGIYMLVFTKDALGWLAVGFAVILWMFIFWNKYELMHVPNGPSDSIDDNLSRDLLRLMPKKPDPLTLSEIVGKTQSGGFLALRYGVTPMLLSIVAATLKEDDAERIFVKAQDIQKKTDSEQLAGAVLGVAMIECMADHEDMLHRMKLEVSDLYNGIIWYNYLHGQVKSMHKPRHTGGLGRDLMFGYTPLLQQFAVNISRYREGIVKEQVHLEQQQEAVDRMIDVFSKGGRQNIAIIGPEGSGRSTLVTTFADRILDADSKISSKLKFRQIFKLDAAALIGVASGRGELESLVTRILNEAYLAKNIILWLDNAQLFFEEGVGSVNLANILLPVIQGGSVRIIFTMNEQRYLEISAHNSQLANALNKIMVEQATEEETMRIMQDHVPQLEYQHNVRYTYWALREAYRLSERYVHDLVMPGRAINLLEAAAGHAEDGLVTDESVQMAVEKVYGVKMQASQNEEEKQRLLNLEDLIHERMVDQENAVKAVSDALRRAAAGVRNENRPIGTFLFLGPTGVGKTELAKAISDVYFKGEGEIVRLDMNEYVTADDVSRLIADGSEDELSLTAQVMKHPFSVVLLDEIEKAHPQVLTTLLQMLDEGILRDVRNREVSFRDAIVIATSNAGAQDIRHFVDSGMDLAEIKDELTERLIRNGEFKPEFINRFDEVCIFSQLPKEALRKIVDLIIDGVNKTLEPKKMHVELDDEAKDVLVEHGYDPKLGARPMRRIVQKTVENIIAKAVLGGELDNGGTIAIDAKMIEESLEK